MPLYFYVSPNATPWAATFMLGKRFSRNEKNVAKMRREWFGHNFDTDAHREELHALNQLR
jgi:hypothetical protein